MTNKKTEAASLGRPQLGQPQLCRVASLRDSVQWPAATQDCPGLICGAASRLDLCRSGGRRCRGMNCRSLAAPTPPRQHRELVHVTGKTPRCSWERGRCSFDSAQGRLFDCTRTSLREVLASLRMTNKNSRKGCWVCALQDYAARSRGHFDSAQGTSSTPHEPSKMLCATSSGDSLHATATQTSDCRSKPQ
jgi:hypothetical protein